MFQAIPTHTRTASAVMPPIMPVAAVADMMTSFPPPGRCGPSGQTDEPGPYAIYVLHDRETDRHYVGLTRRTLAERLSAHRTQARRERPVRPDGLMARLRDVQVRGGPDPFTARVVAYARTMDEACAMEALWIARLRAWVPTGYNVMPGGSSVGPDGNARVLVVRDGHGLIRTHRSIGAALAHRNRELRAEGLPLLARDNVYFRLAAGWPPEEALGYQVHADGRGRRAAFQLDGVSYTSLAAASAATGLGIDTLRSRLHRAPTLSGTMVDITVDRRTRGRGRGTPLGIVWPGTGEMLTARHFAERTGVSEATVLHRWHRAQAAAKVEGRALTPEALHDRLMARQDRRKPLVLRLPDGRRWEGGERELMRRLLADHGLEARRAVRLSDSGIYRRLRLLSGNERRDPACTGWAFGFTYQRMDAP